MYYYNRDRNAASSMRLEINRSVHVLDMGSATGSRRINYLYHSYSEQWRSIFNTHLLDEVSDILQLRFVFYISKLNKYLLKS